MARRHLPRAYNRELPRLANASIPGTPRVYHIALELISHAHGRVDGEGLRAFVASYQEIQPLRLGELWAIPIMLRLALLENLRRVVMAVTAGRHDREDAAYWVEKMLAVAATHPTDVVLAVAALIEADPPLTTSFVAELASQLQAQGSTLAFATTWLEQRLAEDSQTVEHVFEIATQSQAADQVLIGNTTPTGGSVMRIREPADGPVMGYIIDDNGTPTLVAQLSLYMDAPDMSLPLSANHDLHSKPLTVALRGPLTFLPDGRISIALANDADVPVTVNIKAPLGISGSVDMVLPAGQMRLQLVSPPVRGSEK
jgi:hypothetical protein